MKTMSAASRLCDLARVIVGYLAAIVFVALVVMLCDNEMRLRKLWRPTRLASLAGFGLVGLLAAYALHGDGGDLAGFTFGGIWLGAVLPLISGLTAGVTGWFLGCTVIAGLLASRLLNLGTWSILVAFAGLLVGAILLFIGLSAFVDKAYREQSDDYEELRQGQLNLNWMLFGSVFLACQAGSFAIEQWLTDDNAGADLLAGVIGFALTFVVLKLVSYFRGADGRREKREYYSEDDLDGTWIGRSPKQAPESPSILT